MEKESFVFRKEWMDAVAGLPDEVRLEFYEAVIEYGTSGRTSGLKQLAGVAFRFVKTALDRDNARYNDIRQKRSSSAKKRWDDTDECNGMQTMQMNANHANECKPCKCITGDANDDPPHGDNVYVYGLKEITPNGVTKKSAPRFSPPSLEEVRDYIREKGYAFSAESFCDFYQSKGWMVGRNKMRDWKAALRNWQRGEAARAPDGRQQPAGMSDAKAEERRRQERERREASLEERQQKAVTWEEYQRMLKQENKSPAKTAAAKIQEQNSFAGHERSENS